jgi:hypothetical protein
MGCFKPVLKGLRHRLRVIKRMARLCMIALPCIATNAFAEGVDIDILKTNWGVTLGGAAATIAIHELGHFVVAGIEDADAYFDGLTVKYRDYDGSDRQNLRLSSAGYQAQWLASEYAFKQLDQPSLNQKQKAWNAGLILGHIGITVAYLTFLKDEENGDVSGISEATGLSTGEVIALLTIPAVLDSWRLFGKNSPKWAGWTSKGFKAVGITAVWTF